MGRNDDDEFEDFEPSKSELKRQSRDLQDLGDELVALPPAELDALALPDDVRDAVIEGRRITAHGARVRQRLYIGKLLRRIDVEPHWRAAPTPTASASGANTASSSGASGCSRTTPPPGPSSARASPRATCSSCARSRARRGPSATPPVRPPPHASCSGACASC
jgi:hypothetical protein